VIAADEGGVISLHTCICRSLLYTPLLIVGAYKLDVTDISWSNLSRIQIILRMLLTFFAGGSHTHFCEVQEYLPELCRATTTCTTQDNRAAIIMRARLTKPACRTQWAL